MLTISNPKDAKAFAIGANCLLHLFDDIVNHYMFSMQTFVAHAESGVVLYPPWVDVNDFVGKWIKENNVNIIVHYPKKYTIPTKVDTLIYCAFDDACVPKIRFTKSNDSKTVYSFYHYDLYDKLKGLGYIEDVPFISADAFGDMFSSVARKCEAMWHPKNKVMLSYDSTRAPDEMKARLSKYDEVIKEVIPGIKTIQVEEGNVRHFDGEWCHYVDSVKHKVYNQIFERGKI